MAVLVVGAGGVADGLGVLGAGFGPGAGSGAGAWRGLRVRWCSTWRGLRGFFAWCLGAAGAGVGALAVCVWGCVSVCAMVGFTSRGFLTFCFFGAVACLRAPAARPEMPPVSSLAGLMASVCV